MNSKVAAGLIVLTAVVSYGVSRSRQHHFEPTKLGDGSILLDTETGVECSARFDMKWTEANKKAVWAAGLAAKKLEAKYTIHLPPPTPDTTAPVSAPTSSGVPVPEDALPAVPAVTSADQLPPLKPVDYIEQTADLLAAEAKYNELVEKADNEKVPDPDSSYFKSFPLCKDVR